MAWAWVQGGPVCDEPSKHVKEAQRAFPAPSMEQNWPVLARYSSDLILCASVCQKANSSSSHRSSSLSLLHAASINFFCERTVGRSIYARQASM
eukprot:CAMPEP_0194537394 /NCGR_PEP_ID=MMETSP0253-20130528/76646_1 /TAXON_ID=2966 /ORGANISM="Noctiluca scintillans" /LENGTH=93 /DNA_ID=CAMNT_0039383411 /DNA_START=694 /DNA_END=974 /DNA_ORIENTATION=+